LRKLSEFDNYQLALDTLCFLTNSCYVYGGHKGRCGSKKRSDLRAGETANAPPASDLLAAARPPIAPDRPRVGIWPGNARIYGNLTEESCR
jgi:hypothetical protein